MYAIRSYYDIPVSGSLNDPQFSVGGLVWNAIGNLTYKSYNFV